MFLEACSPSPHNKYPGMINNRDSHSQKSPLTSMDVLLEQYSSNLRENMTFTDDWTGLNFQIEESFHALHFSRDLLNDLFLEGKKDIEQVPQNNNEQGLINKPNPLHLCDLYFSQEQPVKSCSLDDCETIYTATSPKKESNMFQYMSVDSFYDFSDRESPSIPTVQNASTSDTISPPTGPTSGCVGVTVSPTTQNVICLKKQGVSPHSHESPNRRISRPHILVERRRSREVQNSGRAHDKRESHNNMEKVRRRLVAIAFEDLLGALDYRNPRKPSKVTILALAYDRCRKYKSDHLSILKEQADLTRRREELVNRLKSLLNVRNI